jgi:hypothetical protein
MNSVGIVQKLWNYCNILRDDGLSYGDYPSAGSGQASRRWSLEPERRRERLHHFVVAGDWVSNEPAPTVLCNRGIGLWMKNSFQS